MADYHHISREQLDLYKIQDILQNDIKLKLSEEYELSAIKKNITTGGVDNTSIPNYVYRWTEREIIKLMKSFRPDLKIKIFFDYGSHIKFTQSKVIKAFF